MFFLIKIYRVLSNVIDRFRGLILNKRGKIAIENGSQINYLVINKGFHLSVKLALRVIILRKVKALHRNVMICILCNNIIRNL